MLCSHEGPLLMRLKYVDTNVHWRQQMGEMKGKEADILGEEVGRRIDLSQPNWGMERLFHGIDVNTCKGWLALKQVVYSTQEQYTRKT